MAARPALAASAGAPKRSDASLRSTNRPSHLSGAPNTRPSSTGLVDEHAAQRQPRRAHALPAQAEEGGAAAGKTRTARSRVVKNRDGGDRATAWSIRAASYRSTRSSARAICACSSPRYGGTAGKGGACSSRSTVPVTTRPGPAPIAWPRPSARACGAFRPRHRPEEVGQVLGPHRGRVRGRRRPRR